VIHEGLSAAQIINLHDVLKTKSRFENPFAHMTLSLAKPIHAVEKHGSGFWSRGVDSLKKGLGLLLGGGGAGGPMMIFGWFFRSPRKGFEIPIDSMGNHYHLNDQTQHRVSSHAHEGEGFAKVASVKILPDGVRLEIIFWVEGWPEKPLALTMSRAQAEGYGINVLQVPYHPTVGEIHASSGFFIRKTKGAETEKIDESPPTPLSAAFVRGRDEFNQPVIVYRPGEEPLEAHHRFSSRYASPKGDNYSHILTVMTHVHPTSGKKKVEIIFNVSNASPPHQRFNNGSVFLSLDEALSLGILKVGPDGNFQRNLEVQKLFILEGPALNLLKQPPWVTPFIP